MLNASVTFDNIFAAERPTPGVTIIRDEERVMCDIDESLFEPPSHYTFIGNETDFFCLSCQIMIDCMYL